MKRKPKTTILTIGKVIRLEPVPYTRVYKDQNKYDRKRKHRKDWE